MKPVAGWRRLIVPSIASLLLTACANGPPVVTAEIICPDRISFTVPQAERIAQRIESLPEDDPLIPYIVRAEGTDSQLDAAGCP